MGLRDGIRVERSLPPKSSEGEQRVGILVEVPQLLRELGCDPNQVLPIAGLDPAILSDPDNSIPFVAMGRLLHACVEETGDQCFGLRLGQRSEASTLGVVGRLMQNAPTLGIAVQDFLANQQRNAKGAVPYLLVQDGVFFVGYAVYQTGVQALDQICDAALAIGLNIVRQLSGSLPTEVLLSHRAPADVAPYRRFFRAPVRFDADQSALVYPVRSLALAVQGANSEIRTTLEAEVRSYWAVSQPDLEAQVTRILRSRIMLGAPTLEEVADCLSLNPRTLNRRLHDQGTTFRAVFNATRFELARQLLEGTSMGVTEIGATFGYADPSVLTRAFHRWSGMTPTEWRERAPGVGPGSI
jgi:AraC-like DNA-binding protein